MIQDFAFAGDVSPDRPGVYLVTTDTPHHFGFFLAWFNGQYWYEHQRKDDRPDRATRKKTARLAITAWSHINGSIFIAPMHEGKKAATELSHSAGRRTEKSMWAQFRESGVMNT